ncbi:MAG: hypothetical protein WAX66_01545 [Patescibacteria group bacterium]
MAVAFAGPGLFTNEYRTSTITGMIVETKVDEGNTYFVFQHDSGQTELLSNKDAWYFGKFNSGDFLMNLKVGTHYEMRVNSMRIPFLSMFRNIVSYEEK